MGILLYIIYVYVDRSASFMGPRVCNLRAAPLCEGTHNLHPSGLLVSMNRIFNVCMNAALDLCMKIASNITGGGVSGLTVPTSPKSWCQGDSLCFGRLFMHRTVWWSLWGDGSQHSRLEHSNRELLALGFCGDRAVFVGRNVSVVMLP